MDGWTLTGIILGGVALVMATQPFTQNIWGRPKIETAFSYYDVADGKVLQCEIRNTPVTHPLLRLLCVTRATAENVMAGYVIEEHGTGRIVFSGLIAEIKTHAGYAAQRVSLPGAIMPAAFGIVVATEGKVCPFGREINEPILPTGVYVAKITIEVGGKVMKRQGGFVVSNKHPFVYWNDAF